MPIKDMFRPKWKHSDFRIRKAAVKNLDNISILINIIKNDDNEEVRRTALKTLASRVGDERILIEIAENSDYPWRQKDAISQITDQSILGHIAKNNNNYELRRIAVTFLNDQCILGEIAKEDSLGVYGMLTDRISDQLVLVDIAKNAVSVATRENAVDRIIDQNFLAEIAVNTNKWNVRKAAVKRISNQKLVDKYSVRYIIRDDDTVEDIMTGLIWQRVVPKERFSWNTAMTYANNNTAGLPGSDWRLPFYKELDSIADVDMMKAFPNSPSGYYWSSDYYQRAGFVEGNYAILILHFPDFRCEHEVNNYVHYLRCVKGHCQDVSHTWKS